MLATQLSRASIFISTNAWTDITTGSVLPDTRPFYNFDIWLSYKNMTLPTAYIMLCPVTRYICGAPSQYYKQ